MLIISILAVHFRASSPRAAVALPEIMITVLLIAAFFAGIFELNAICLRYIEASKESVSAIQGVHDRIETLRSLAFTDLTSQSYMTTLLTSPADTSSFSPKVTEVVTLTDYLSGTPSVTFTRTPGASVTPTVAWSGGTSFPSTTTIVKANVRFSWNMTFGGRPRTEQTETMISDGVKK